MISKHVVFLPTVLLVVLLDQLGKQHVVETLGLGERVALLPGVIAWTHVPSVGGAFGVFRDWLPAAQLAGLAVLSRGTPDRLMTTVELDGDAMYNSLRVQRVEEERALRV